MKKLIIIEGPDRTGKDTLINKLKMHYNTDNVIHFTGAKRPLNKCDNNIQQMHKFTDSYLEIKHTDNDITLWNRSFIGQFVYGQIYHGNNQLDWIYEIDEGLTLLNIEIYLIMLYGDSEFLFHNDDGCSISNSIEDIEAEQEYFKWFFVSSKIKNKVRICATTNTNYIQENIIFQEVLNLIK